MIKYSGQRGNRMENRTVVGYWLILQVPVDEFDRVSYQWVRSERFFLTEVKFGENGSSGEV